MPDWNDSHILNELANQTIKTANDYRMARKKYADAKYALDMILSKKYLDGTIPKKLAYEKALIFLCEKQEEEIMEYYLSFVKEEANYKGLEKVLAAQESKISLCQSLIKNQIRNT